MSPFTFKAPRQAMPSAALARPVMPRPVFMSPSDGARLIYLLMKQARPGLETVQFVATRDGEGTTSVVRDLGLIAASLGVRVLILDLDGAGQEHATWLRTQYGAASPDTALRRWRPMAPGAGQDGPSGPDGGPSSGLDDGLDDDPGLPDFTVLQLGNSSLCVSYRTDPVAVSPARYVQTLSRLRGEFELILVDVPAFSHSADSLLLAPHVFATLLVVAAEQTRVQVVDDLRNQIVECGGVVSGMVLNRRRLHIPKMIYDRL